MRRYIMPEGSPEPANGTKDFLLTEFDLLKEMRASGIAQSENQLKFFITIVSGTTAVLAVLAQLGKKDLMDVSLPLVIPLFVVGVLVFIRLIEAHISITVYTRGLNRIRRYFLDNDRTIEKYLILPVSDDTPTFGRIGFLSTRISVAGLTALATIINSALAFAFFSILSYRVWSILCVAVIVGVLGFLLSIVAHHLYNERQTRNASNKVGVEFPENEKGAQP
jgi:hypothetical protein